MDEENNRYAFADNRCFYRILRCPTPFMVQESMSWRRAREHVDALNRRDVPRRHSAMLNDFERNRAYDESIRAVVREGDIVLEIGSG